MIIDRSDVLKKILLDIRLEKASPQKRIQKNDYLDYVSKNRDSLLNSGQSLVYEFTVRVNEIWKGSKGTSQTPRTTYHNTFCLLLLRVALRKQTGVPP